jgi:hypothetical protein
VLVIIRPDLSEQPGGGFTAHVAAIGALPELIGDRFWKQVKTIEDLDTELVGEESSCFILSAQYQQGLQDMLAYLQAKYSVVAEWLEYYLCNNQPKDLFHSEKIHYKSFAEYLLAKLRLCQEVHSKAVELQSLLAFV